jgi:glycosyltransferase involved in cell wall biosynthesis
MVLHLSTFHLEGGAGVAATRLHRALQKSGTGSRMLVPSSQNPEENVTALAENSWESKKAWGRFVAERLYFFPHEKDNTVRFAFSPAEIGADISNHPLVRQADILHLHWINFGFLSLTSLDKLFSLGKPVVWTLHDMWTVTGGCHYSRGCDHYLSHCQYCPYLAKPEQYDISFSQFETKKHIYEKAKMALVSPSQWLDRIVKHAALTQSTYSKSIPNCIDTDLFAPSNKKLVREKLDLPTDKKLILFAGANTQDPRKGFSYFKDALTLLSDDVEVLVLGKANPAVFDSFPAPVHYLGKITRQEDMVDAYNAADMIVVPSLEDNLPNTIMEAMACGTPAVGFATGGIPEMIDHKQNGYVSEFKSSDSLAEGISWILSNNSNGQISEHARTKVLSTYSENIIATQYQNLYQSLLSE